LKGPNHFGPKKIGPNNGFCQFGPNTQKGRKQLGRMQFGPKMAETSSSGPPPKMKIPFNFGFSWNIYVFINGRYENIIPFH
jgi:hypothetical protein